MVGKVEDLEARRRMLEGGGMSDRPDLDCIRLDNEMLAEVPMDGGGPLQFAAAHIRKERTGTHAKITISINGQTCAYSWLNCDRDEDRTRLANSAANRFSTAKLAGAAVKVRLDRFCERLWEEWTHTDTGEWLDGNEQHRPQWLLDPFVLESGGTILFGPPGGGKSWIGIIWSLGIQHGSLPWTCRPASTLFVNLERSAPSIQWRLARVGRVLGIPQPRLLSISARGRTLDDVLDSVKVTVKKHGVELVIVDSLSRSGTGDMNGNEPANRAMDALNSLGVAWTVIGHSPRGDNTHVFGSQMFDAAADLCVRLTSTTSEDERTLGIALETTKANDARRAGQQQWALEFDDIGPTAFRRARDGEFVDLAPVKVATRQVVYEHLLTNGKDSATGIAEATGLDRSRIAHVLRSSEFVRLGEEKRGKGRSEVLYGVVMAVPQEAR